MSTVHVAGMRPESAYERRMDCDRTAIADLMQWMTECWDAGDGASYGELFTHDCDCIAFDATHLKGRQQTARHHQALFETVLKGSRLVFEGLPQIRFLDRDIAVMHAMCSVHLLHDCANPTRQSPQTYVLVRRSQGCWHIAALHAAGSPVAMT
jgi:uncharacterized protein (TIGR02246 family)